MTAPDLAAETAAVVAMLRTGGCDAYSVGDLRRLASPPEHYTEVHVVERFLLATRAGGGTGDVRGFTVLLRAVAMRYENAQQERKLAAAAVEGARVVVGGVSSSPVERSVSDDPIGPDDGWFSGLSEWSYAR